MACSDKLVVPEEVPRKERRVKGKEFAREIDATREALVVVVEALEAKNKGCGCSRVDTGKEEIQTERAVVVALVEALRVKKKQAEMETGKEAVAIEDKEKQTEMENGKEAAAIEQRSLVDRIFDEYEVVDLFEDTSGEVDEEVIKEVAELQEYCNQMWLDCVNRALKAGLKFGDASHGHCLVGCD